MEAMYPFVNVQYVFIMHCTVAKVSSNDGTLTRWRHLVNTSLHNRICIYLTTEKWTRKFESTE